MQKCKYWITLVNVKETLNDFIVTNNVAFG